MGRQTVVLQPPPANEPRKVVVSRAGPPHRDRRRTSDMVVGILGILILIVAVILVASLPQDAPPAPQYEVTYDGSTVEDATGAEAEVLEGGSAEFAFPYDGDRLYRIEVTVTWVDDIISSRPDTFELELHSPTGEVVAGPRSVVNPEPVASPDETVPGTSAIARPASAVMAFNVAERPSTQVIAAENGETEADIQSLVLQESMTPSTGTWTLVARLLDAGDCPDPETLETSRMLLCQTETGGGTDDGNPFQVLLVSFTEYSPSVRAL